jgi:glucokinase
VRVTAGVDLGGTAVNYTFLTTDRKWLIEGLCEHPARAIEGPDICLQQIADGLIMAAGRARIAFDDIAAVGLDTPGPASAAGVLSARGSTKFVHPDWAGFDIPRALAARLGKPVT